MKNAKSKVNIIALFVVLLSSCSGNNGMPRGFSNVDLSISERERYNNKFDNSQIPNQWDDYGIGDPYILRHDGEYYLYVSTKNEEYGYRVWRSQNLVEYDYLGHFLLKDIHGDYEDFHSVYAPEVHYWNGDFYMYASIAGKGHYVFKSENKTPHGDYVAITGNIGLNIDGTVFIDDDEKMYFMSAGFSAIRSYEMNNMSDIKPSTEKELHSPLVLWTEGPSLIKHNDTYFLTYTGNNVKSKGYRVDYSYSKTSPRNDFKYPANNSLLLSTDDNFNGLGHSSSVLGPDLDSYYIAYHNLESAAGPVRSFNINRLSFSGTRMSVIGPSHQGIMVPALPNFYLKTPNENNSHSLDDNGSGALLSNSITGSFYTAEYNFANYNPNGNQRFIFAEQAGKFGYITIKGKIISVYYDGILLGSGLLENDFDWTATHSLRLALDSNRLEVYFDNLKKITIENSTGISGGRIGYYGIAKNNIKTTVFTNHAFDSSDKCEPKIAPGSFWSSSFVPSASKSAGTSILDYDIEDDRFIYSEASSVSLKKRGDKIVFPIDVSEDGIYGIESVYSLASAGGRITVQVNNERPYLIEVPGVNFSNNFGSYENNLKYVKNHLVNLELEEGINTLKFELLGGQFESISYELSESSAFIPSFEHDLSQYVEQGASYMTLWKIDENEKAHYSKAGSNNLVLFGSSSMADYEASVDIKINMDAANDAVSGLLVRASNMSMMAGQVNESGEGYYISFNNMQLVMSRIQYNSIIVASATGDNALRTWHNLKVRCQGNNIKVYFDDEFSFEYTDPYPFFYGQVGLYSVSAQAYYRNLKIRGI